MAIGSITGSSGSNDVGRPPQPPRERRSLGRTLRRSVEPWGQYCGRSGRTGQRLSELRSVFEHGGTPAVQREGPIATQPVSYPVSSLRQRSCHPHIPACRLGGKQTGSVGGRHASPAVICTTSRHAKPQRTVQAYAWAIAVSQVSRGRRTRLQRRCHWPGHGGRARRQDGSRRAHRHRAAFAWCTDAVRFL